MNTSGAGGFHRRSVDLLNSPRRLPPEHSERGARQVLPGSFVRRMSPKVGPTPTYRHVRQLPAFWGDADISQPSPSCTSACSVMTVPTAVYS
jgi:hypothetical protein